MVYGGLIKEAKDNYLSILYKFKGLFLNDVYGFLTFSYEFLFFTNYVSITNYCSLQVMKQVPITFTLLYDQITK